MSIWRERVREEVLNRAPRTWVAAGSEWGFQRVIPQLRDPDRPLIWLDLEGLDCEDDVILGDALSEAVREGLGAPLFGMGIGLDYGISALRSLMPALAPLAIAVSSGHCCPRAVDALDASVESPNIMIVQVSEESGWYPLDSRWRGMGRAQLALSQHEVLDMFSNERGERAILEAWEASGGAVGRIEEALALDWPSPGRGAHRRSNQFQGDAYMTAVDTLIRRSRWIDGFELTVARAPHRAPEVIGQAGNQYLISGQYERFWRHASQLASPFLRDASVRYWHFAAAVAANQWVGLLADVDAFLRHNEAPELRALRATTVVDATSLVEATRAYRAKPIAQTASAMGFVQLVYGLPRLAIGSLREALEIAEHAGDSRLVVSTAVYIAMAETSLGHYDVGQHWASWALRRFDAWGMREELLRLSVVSVKAYASLLTGNVSSAQQALSTVRVDEGWIGIPSVEGIVSTLGDMHLVGRNPERALEYYEMNLGYSGNGNKGTLLLDAVRGYIRLGDVEAAMSVAAQLKAIAGDSDEDDVRFARLALGIASMSSDASAAEENLSDALDAFLAKPFGAGPAEAALALATLRFDSGRVSDARAVLLRAKPYLDRLGESGWRLLCPFDKRIRQLRSLLNGDEPGLTLRLMGAQDAEVGSRVLHLSPRFAELLTILAAHPEGIRGEALALALYGERANQSTLKATVSRARKIVPIDSGPYRIAEPFRADFAEVLVLLQNGRVQAALELYRGPLLPESRAPMVVELRGYIEESLRQAVLASDDPDALIDFANQQGEDLQLWEEALRQLPPNDPRRPLVNARIRRIRKGW